MHTHSDSDFDMPIAEAMLDIVTCDGVTPSNSLQG